MSILKQLIFGVKSPLPDSSVNELRLNFVAGIESNGEPYSLSMTKCVHGLVVGASGAGKTVGLQYQLSTLLGDKANSNFQLKILDVKLSQFSFLKNDPRVQILPTIDLNSDDQIDIGQALADEAKNYLHLLKLEISRRIRLLAKIDCEDLSEYYERGYSDLPPIITVIDEYAFIINNCESVVDSDVGDIMAIGRSVGIHIIISTQYPHHSIISKDKSGNASLRVSFKVKNKVAELVAGVEGGSTLRGAGKCYIDLDWIEKPVKLTIPYWGSSTKSILKDISKGTRDYSGELINPPKKRGLLYKLIIGN